MTTGSVRLADGREYVFSPLTIGDLEEFARYARYSHLRDVEEQTRGIPEAIRKYLVDRAYERCAQMVGDEIRSVMKSLEGARYMFWLSLRKEHPEVTLANVGSLISPQSLEAIRSEFERSLAVAADA